MENITLLEKISSKGHLELAWRKLEKARKHSHGLSGKTIADFEKEFAQSDDKINSLSAHLKKETYRFRPYRPVLIPKDNGDFRPLQIPEVSDRIILKAIALELEVQFKTELDQNRDVSFAYQTGLGVKNAIEKIKEYYNQGYTFVLEADLKNFFGEVDKDKLINEIVLPRLSDSSIDSLITSALNQTIGELDKHIIGEKKQRYFDHVGDGIPQGNALSPLLSNIYLSPFDNHIKTKGFKLIRYADDFVIMCKSQEECLNAYKECLYILGKENLNLPIHELDVADSKGRIKTRIIDLNKETITFLSVTFDGMSYYPSRGNVDRLKNKISTVCSGTKEHTVMSLLEKVNNRYEGWVSAFYYTDIERYYQEIDSHINRQLYLGLDSVGWKFTPKSLGILPSQFRPSKSKTSARCLSQKQRKASGIPTLEELVKIKRKNNSL